jgi:ribosomal protein S18 acetylase RimI-like enzyme
MPIDVVVEQGPEPSDLSTLEQGLIDHALSRGIEPRNHRTLAILLRDGEGRVVGGLAGTTVWGWLQVTMLWVDEAARGQGHGAALMREAEAEAVRRGCHHALLDTFDFQAREFYECLGYETFGELDEFPRGHTRYFMRKTL